MPGGGEGGLVTSPDEEYSAPPVPASDQEERVCNTVTGVRRDVPHWPGAAGQGADSRLTVIKRQKKSAVKGVVICQC